MAQTGDSPVCDSQSTGQRSSKLRAILLRGDDRNWSEVSLFQVRGVCWQARSDQSSRVVNLPSHFAGKPPGI
ncbi:hypothetical protein CEXT_73901 [Caerostris extrusa]|uniref:Uncharacterized protein n=1 Tax=Caerostris extrusa TaxID=172846 RepID=A0AAV4P7T8_CAEEX|nr:hypothetical protein CEXT_73901 [Caerostris extrusa]